MNSSRVLKDLAFKTVLSATIQRASIFPKKALVAMGTSVAESTLAGIRVMPNWVEDSMARLISFWVYLGLYTTPTFRILGAKVFRVANWVFTGNCKVIPVILSAERSYFSRLGTMQKIIGISDISRLAILAADGPIAITKSGFFSLVFKILNIFLPRLRSFFISYSTMDALLSTEKPVRT